MPTATAGRGSWPYHRNRPHCFVIEGTDLGKIKKIDMKESKKYTTVTWTIDESSMATNASGTYLYYRAVPTWPGKPGPPESLAEVKAHIGGSDDLQCTVIDDTSVEVTPGDPQYYDP